VNPALLTLLTFLAAVLAVVAAYSILSDLYLRDRSRVERRVDTELLKRQRERAGKSALFKNFDPGSLGGPDDDEASLPWRQRLELLIEQAGLDFEPRKLLALMAGAGLVFGPLVALLFHGPLRGLAAGLLAAALPLLYVLRRRKVRLNKLMAQLPDAFDLMARVIRAGQTMSQALQAVADEFDQPVSAEFAYCFEQQNLGLAPELALRDLGRRTGLLEIRIFVLALLVQQQTGGNLAEMLDRLATLIRERFRIRGKIRALTAEGRIQALVLLALPPLLLLLILLLNRSYGEILLENPNLLIGMFVSEAVGALWIRKIVNFDF
jgi:tight adherence protein B